MNLSDFTREVAMRRPYKAEPAKSDNWQTARETAKLRSGDCEDSTFEAVDDLRTIIVAQSVGKYLCRLILGPAPGGWHAWLWVRFPNGEEWWADPTFGGPGLCSQELWPGYEPHWAYDFAEDGQLVNPQEVRRKADA